MIRREPSPETKGRMRLAAIQRAEEQRCWNRVGCENCVYRETLVEGAFTGEDKYSIAIESRERRLPACGGGVYSAAAK